MSAFADACSLICPKCYAANKPKATVIVQEQTEAICIVCRHRWALVIPELTAR